MPYNVLVVDDETPVRDLFNDLLKKEDYAVQSVATGEEALELITKCTLDIVLLDIKLSGISGLDTLKQIKTIKPEIIVIMITGFGYDQNLIDKAMEYGCSGYIGKNMPISKIMSSFRLFIKAAKNEQ